MSRGKIVIYTKQDRNFFVFDLIKSEKAMAIACERPRHVITKNKQIQIWHCRLKYASNARVVRASKLVDGININSTKYNPEEVFINSNLSEIDK